MARMLISQGTFKTDFREKMSNFSFEVVKRSVLNEAMIFCNCFDQNYCFLRNHGPL